MLLSSNQNFYYPQWQDNLKHMQIYIRVLIATFGNKFKKNKFFISQIYRIKQTSKEKQNTKKIPNQNHHYF